MGVSGVLYAREPREAGESTYKDVCGKEMVCIFPYQLIRGEVSSGHTADAIRSNNGTSCDHTVSVI